MVLDEPVAPQTPESRPQEFLDGGDVTGLRISSSSARVPGFSEERHNAESRSWLAKIVFIVFASVIGLQYVVLAVFLWFGKSEKALETLYNTTLPAISGLAGTAAAFYFKESRR